MGFFSARCEHCYGNLWEGLNIEQSDLSHFTGSETVDIKQDPQSTFPRAYFMFFNNLRGTIVSIKCEVCLMDHLFNQTLLDSAYNAITDEWRYSCSNNMTLGTPLANKSLNTLMHLDRWIEKQIVIQKNPLNQRYATNPVNPANYANVLIRDLVPPIQEPKSTQYGGLSKEEWDQLKPWQQFKHLDKIKNPSHYYQEGQPLL
jgi:hypothetical protein